MPMNATKAKTGSPGRHWRIVTKIGNRPEFIFLRQFFAHPRAVGSVIPTSRHAIDRLLDTVDWSRVRTVVEYGPGTGVFTRRILRRLNQDARLIAIELNPVFVRYVRGDIDDTRLQIVQGSASDVRSILDAHGIDGADVIVSGLPFSTLPDGVADIIMDATVDAIRPGGQFLVYQYSRFVEAMLRARFPIVSGHLAWRCIPPARLFVATRQ